MGVDWLSVRSRDVMTWGMLVLVFIFQLITPARPATQAEELTTSKVDVAFYMITVENWNGDARAKFMASLLKQANSYCRGDLAACGFQSFDTTEDFDNADFKETTTSSFPSYTKPKLSVQFALALPTNVVPAANQNTHYLKKTALEAIVVNSRVPLSSSDNVQITHVGSSDYGPVPNSVLNGSISAAFAALILILVIVLLVLRAKCSDDEYTQHILSKKESVAKEIRIQKNPDEVKKKKDPEAMIEKYQEATGRVLTPVMRLTPEPVNPKKTEEDPTKLEDTQNGSTQPTVVTVKNAES